MNKSTHFLPVGRSLSLIVVTFVGIVASLLLLNNVRSEILSGVRAYVSGEGLYSKAQKDAVNHLLRYAQTHAETDYGQYLRALAVPLSDRDARLELEKPQPDLARVRSGFVTAHNHPEDVDTLAFLFRRFRHVSYMAHAIEVWGRADALIEQLRQVGDRLHASIASGDAEVGTIAPLLDRIDALNDQLTGLEDEFSRSLGAGSRWLERRLLQIMYAATLLLVVAGVFLSWLILRQVKEAERQRKRADALDHARARQHETIARLGETALRGRDLESLMDEAAIRVTGTLAVDICEVLELEGGALHPRAVVGIRRELVGGTVDASSPAGQTLSSAAPVVIHDLRTDTRFAPSLPLRAAGVISGMSVAIAGEGRHQYGVLSAYATRAQSFTRDDVNFLCAVANVLGTAIQRKRAEEALHEANRQKDDFLSMLAHELRNPLSPIRTAVYLLRRLGPKEARVEQAHQMIERQVAQLTRLVDDLLDVSRIGRGKISLHQEITDFGALVRLASEDYRPSLEAAGLTLTSFVPEEPVWVRGDPARLSQALGNLLHNAAKFTPAGGAVTVRLATDPAARTTILRVRDTGIGMEPAVLAQVFEPFSQADHSLERGAGGLGLGLALVKGLVVLHGGTVGAASQGLGEGSEFTIQLPLEDGPGHVADRAVPKPSRHRPRRVLVIEDNLDVAESMKALLELEGHQVTVAHTGPAGLEVAREFRPEVVLCDLGLPDGMNGFAVAQAMRNDARLQSTYLVALTGYGQREDRRRTREAGFDLHLTKPVDPALLDQVLASLAARDQR